MIYTVPNPVEILESPHIASPNGVVIATPNMSLIALNPEYDTERRIAMARLAANVLGKSSEFQELDPIGRQQVFMPLDANNEQITPGDDERVVNFVSEEYWVMLRTLAHRRIRNDAPLRELSRSLMDGIDHFYQRHLGPLTIVDADKVREIADGLRTQPRA